MKIVFFETMPGEREAFQRLLPPGHDVSFFEKKLIDDGSLIAQAEDADIISVFVNCDVSATVMDRFPSLKLIATRSMGYDHIDLDHATTKGIKVTNVTTYAAHPVAEFTFALLLAIGRHIATAYERVREETDFDVREYRGITLYGKTLGVIGTGRIGEQVIRIAQGFGMQVMAFDAFPNDALAQEIGFLYLPLDDVLARADVITLHLPYSQDTHHILNTNAFLRMKKGTYLVNTARGELIDSKALLAALEDGTIAGAGLDVLEEEDLLKKGTASVLDGQNDVDHTATAINHLLIDHPRALVTPHIAFSTDAALQEIERATAESIATFIAGIEQRYL